MTGSFITSIIEKYFLLPLRIILTNVQWSTLRSLLYSLCQTQCRVYNRSGTQHEILYRTYDWGIGNDFHSLSIFCCGRALSLTQLHTLQHRQELFLWLFHFELLQNLVKVCTHWKNLSSVLIYLYRSWCSICKHLHRGLSLKNFFQNTPLCFAE